MTGKVASKFDAVIKKNISRRRNELRLSQASIAQELGLDRNTYRYIESGKTVIVSEHLDRIAEILGITPEELILGFNPLDIDSDPRLESFKVDYGHKTEGQIHELQSEIAHLYGVVDDQKETIAILKASLKDKEDIINLLKSKLGI